MVNITPYVHILKSFILCIFLIHQSNFSIAYKKVDKRLTFSNIEVPHLQLYVC